MIYNIYYCPVRDTCFGLPAGVPFINFFNHTGAKSCEFLAIYETETDYLEVHDTHFTWYNARDDWDEELNRVIQEIIDSPVVWYCLIHDKFYISDRYTPPRNPCQEGPHCICEQIATYVSGKIISNVGDIGNYFKEVSSDLTEADLEKELAMYQLQDLTL